ncbi:hypothetical protein LOTGIDRAFT_175058 [Lottia gigantea]|uniref:C2 domain-containing protein n=1 Tax=Lottia gigantea TaxID=225164 RepID=V4AQF4_LOTGI|nr:hypothetical protein LOTGIDRAFT_175058 [Lottia gigantea]ESO95891.1 hypothetical protein LOTGIDRAFT_175058 [Lottia gigantea]
MCLDNNNKLWDVICEEAVILLHCWSPLGMGAMEDEIYGSDDDGDLEAELAELMGGGGPKKVAPKRKGNMVNLSMIDKLAADTMKYIDDDVDVSDTEDPDLLAELQEIADEDDDDEPAPKQSNRAPDVVPPVQPRSQPVQPSYQPTVQSSTHKPVQPPPSNDMIFMPTTSGATAGHVEPSTSHNTSTPPAIDKETHRMLASRRDQYKQAALKSKHSNDIATATKYVKIAKQFDMVIKALEEGKEIDLSQMPPPPPQDVIIEKSAPPSQPPVQRAAMQAAPEKPSADNLPELPTATKEEEKAIFGAPDEPKTVMEALEQRLEKYKFTEAQAKKDGESGKARRMGRIVKQYQEAIRAQKAGRAVDYEELPTPPGFAPIPVGKPSPSKTSPQKPAPSSTAGSSGGPGQQPAASKPPTHGAVGGTAPSNPGPSLQPQPPDRSVSPRKSTSNIHHDKSPGQITNRGESVRKSHSKADHQLVFLKERYEEFKTCALNAKKNNDLELAKKYLRIMKGLEPMIQAAECGLPVDLSQVPKSPNMPDSDDKFTIVSPEDCVPTGDRTEVYQKLEENLIQQIRTCVTNGQHYTKLDYEEKKLDTYVTYDFPFPTEQSQTDHSETFKGSINPEYQEHFRIQIARKSRSFIRVIERKSIKLDVYYKRGFFKSEKLLGSINIKLQPLESKCEIHDSYDLMDGRKSVGGKLEVKMRIRDPVKSKQVEEVKEKWLIIDQFLRTAASKSHVQAPKPKNEGSTSMEVLKFEKQQLDKQIEALKDSLTELQTQTLKQKSSLLLEKVELQQKYLREGGKGAIKEYLLLLQKEIPAFSQEAVQLTKVGEIQKAQTMLMKKKLAEKELTVFKSKFPDI